MSNPELSYLPVYSYKRNIYLSIMPTTDPVGIWQAQLDVVADNLIPMKSTHAALKREGKKLIPIPGDDPIYLLRFVNKKINDQCQSEFMPVRW